MKTLEILKAENNHYVDIDLSDTPKIISKIKTSESHSIDEKFDYAVIIKLSNKNFQNRKQICVAGLGESGTAGAAWFLANKWKELLNMAGCQDFGCILKVKFGQDESAEIVKLFTYADYEKMHNIP